MESRIEQSEQLQSVTDSLRLFCQSVFPEGVAFGFVCGSSAEYGRLHSDIDVLVCVDALTETERQSFVDWYYQQHEIHGVRPDEVYPGELMLYEELVAALETAEVSVPSVRIINSEVYDGLVWAGMLSGPKAGLMDEAGRLDPLTPQADRIIDNWCDSLELEKHPLNPGSVLGRTVVFDG
jgi:hypothetical protein